MDGAVNLRSCSNEVVPANGVVIKQNLIGDIPCNKLDKYGSHVNCTRINRVSFGKGNTFNLFSANNAMQHDWMATGNRDNGWTIEDQAGDKVHFDIRISTATSCIWCGYFKRIETPKDVEATAIKEKPVKLPIMKAHDLLGHGDQAKTKATAIALGWTICRGGWCRCEHCAKA